MFNLGSLKIAAHLHVHDLLDLQLEACGSKVNSVKNTF